MNTKVKTAVQSAASDSPILGTYDGECMDSTITNKNGIDITADVIANVLESDDYKQGIKYGWFLGFLGHPEDPNCMDFKESCIVMRDMRLDDNGKVFGKWDLLDTPVGQVVQVLQKAGVTFGISIRGAGDIVGNEVDPDTFIFRGFDLVSFPAFPESIPTFTEIAASTDLEARKKYQTICAAVETRLSSITSSSALDIIKSQFAKQSDTYKKIEARQAELNATEVTATTDFNAEKINAMTNLYLDQLERSKVLATELERTKINAATQTSAMVRKQKALQRITAAQQTDLSNELEATRKQNKVLATKVTKLNAKYIAACKQVEDVKSDNLLYKQKVDTATATIKSKDRIIASMQTEQRKTVASESAAARRVSNRDAEIARLKTEITACKQMLADYQQSYASLYAGGLGIDLTNTKISAATSVKELQRLISAATNTANIAPVVDTVDMIDNAYDNTFDTDEDDDENLVTI